MSLTQTAKDILNTLDSLPEAEQNEVIREVLRRTTLSEHHSPNDDELIAAADELFLNLDQAENEE